MIFGLESFAPALQNDSPAAERLRTTGLPTRSVEAWKYTNLALLNEGTWELAERLPDDELPARTQFATYPGAASGEIVLLNGRFVETWSKVPAGVKVRTAVAGELNGTLQADLNSALAKDELIIEISASLREPLVISQFSFGTTALAKWAAAAPRVSVALGRGVEAAVVEMFAGEGRTLTAAVSSFAVAQAARLSHARFNLVQDSGVQLGFASISLARDSFCETYQFTLGGRLSREDLRIALTAPGAEIVLDGLYLAHGKRHVDHASSVEHLAPNTTSAQLYKGILNDEARAVFNGRVKIARDAQQSNAAQLNNNLILSKRAEVDTKPELEIDADDVKASHGATIGQIDADHVFYLKARGIPEAQAVSMLSKGFAQDVAFRIQNSAIRSAAEEIVEEALKRLPVTERLTATAAANGGAADV